MNKKERHFSLSITPTFENNFFFFNWDSLHTKLNSDQMAQSYKKKKHKKTKA